MPCLPDWPPPLTNWLKETTVLLAFFQSEKRSLSSIDCPLFNLKFYPINCPPPIQHCFLRMENIQQRLLAILIKLVFMGSCCSKQVMSQIFARKKAKPNNEEENELEFFRSEFEVSSQCKPDASYSCTAEDLAFAKITAMYEIRNIYFLVLALLLLKLITRSWTNRY